MTTYTDRQKACESRILPERDSSKPAEEQGLFRKFDIRRVDKQDQPGGKHRGCEYFVLDVTHDVFAKAALVAYAAACEASHPALAVDMRKRYYLESAATSADLSDRQKALIDLIRNDAYATSFQTMGQYRTALLKEAAAIESTSPITGFSEPDGGAGPVDYGRVVSICDAHGIGLPVDCIEMVVEIIQHAAFAVAPTPSATAPAALTDEQILAIAWKYRYDEPDASGYDFGTRSLLEFARALLATNPSNSADGEAS